MIHSQMTIYIYIYKYSCPCLCIHNRVCTHSVIFIYAERNRIFPQIVLIILSLQSFLELNIPSNQNVKCPHLRNNYTRNLFWILIFNIKHLLELSKYQYWHYYYFLWSKVNCCYSFIAVSPLNMLILVKVIKYNLYVFACVYFINCILSNMIDSIVN